MTGFLIDLDGVIYIDNEIIPGARETIEFLKDKGHPYLFITNTTMRTPEEILLQLKNLGIPAEQKDVLSTPMAAIDYLKDSGVKSCYPIVREPILPMFSVFEYDDRAPDCVVLGDIGPRWDYNLLNKLFLMIMNGSRLIALHKGKYWRRLTGLTMDIGCFVTGLEYCTGVHAEIIGKPSSTYFKIGLEKLGTTPADTIMIGDDLESDMIGAHQNGIRGVLVRTGKFDAQELENSDFKPWHTVDSVADLQNILKNS